MNQQTDVYLNDESQTETVEPFTGELMKTDSPHKEANSSSWEEDRDLFYELIRQEPVRKKYAQSFIAVYQGHIVDSDRDKLKLARRIVSRYGLVELFVGFVGEQKVSKVLSPKRV